MAKSFEGVTKLKDRGVLQGDLSSVTPFLFIAYSGVGRSEYSEPAPGEFMLGCSSGDGYAWHGGLIVPIAFVEDPELRRTAHGLHAPEALCTRLSQVFGVSVAGNGPTRSVAADREFFRRLQGAVSYVAEVRDPLASSQPCDPFLGMGISGFGWSRRRDDMRPLSRAVGVTRLEPWRWQTYGELAEDLFYEREGQFRWSRIRPWLVLGDTARLPNRLTASDDQRSLSRPADRFEWLFRLADDAPKEAPAFRFRMGEHGWAYLDVAHRAQVACARLSEVYDPFMDIAAWGLAVQEDDLPIEVAIDEEGSLFYLSAYRTSHPDRVAMFVEDDQRRVLLRCAPERTALASMLREELRRFFTSEFVAESWRPNEDDDDPPYPTRELVLDHPFLRG